MPEAPTHDGISLAVGIPLAIVAALFLPSGAVLTWFIAYVFSCFLLSPDLDLHSDPYLRWGPLRFIWKPYMRVVPHRSWVSHGFLVGSFIRVVYLLTIPAVLLYATTRFGFLREELVVRHWRYGVVVLLGIEAGAAVHIVADIVSTTLKHLKTWLFPRR